MASAIRRASADLDGDALSRFRSAPWRFDVWQAGAILEAWKGRMDWGVPASDIIPAGEVRGVAFPEGGAPRLDVNLLGLAGMDGPLPPHVALLVRERMRAGGPGISGVSGSVPQQDPASVAGYGVVVVPGTAG